MMNIKKMIRDKNVLPILIGIGIIIILIYLSGTEDIISVLRKIHPIWIILAILIYNINWFLRGYRWQIILRYMGHKIGLKKSISLTVLGNFANLITPAKIGDFARAFVLKRSNNVDISKGLFSVIVDRILDLFGVTILAYLSFTIISKDLSLPEWVKILIDNSTYILIIGFIVISIIYRFRYSLFRRSLFRYSLLEDINKICKPKEIAILCFLSIVLWVFEISTTVILFYSLNLDMNIPLIMSAIMIANLTKALPLTPGGIGAYEGTVAAILTIGGLSYSLSITIGILDHGIKNIYTLLFGAFSLSYNGVDIGNITESKTREFNINDKENNIV